MDGTYYSRIYRFDRELSDSIVSLREEAIEISVAEVSQGDEREMPRVSFFFSPPPSPARKVTRRFREVYRILFNASTIRMYNTNV